jgi:hypothetical protein
MARTVDPVGRHLALKLGKKPARPGAVKFKFANFLVKLKLPTPPKVFGHEGLIGANWEVLGNDHYGDCVWAGAAHETMLWNKEAARTVTFSNDSVLKDYSAVTGFNPNDPNTDQGTDMQVAASYRRKKGVLDAHGKRHKVIAYLALAAGNADQLALAMYLFGAAGIGIKVSKYRDGSIQCGQAVGCDQERKDRGRTLHSGSWSRCKGQHRHRHLGQNPAHDATLLHEILR